MVYVHFLHMYTSANIPKWCKVCHISIHTCTQLDPLNCDIRFLQTQCAMLRHSRCYLTAFACCPAGSQFLPCGSNSFYKHTTNHINVPWREIRHRENSPVTQTTPEPTLSFWGSWPREKNFPHPWPHCKPGLIALIGPHGPYCSQTLWNVTETKFAQNLRWLGNWH